MESLAFLLVAPLLWPFIAKALWKHELTVREIAANVAIGALIVVIGWAGGRYVQTADTEFLNGEVLSKASHRVSCSHSYECNCSESCSTDSNGSSSCTTTCSTCYEHGYDVSHTLKTNIGDIDIDRVDRQGLIVPERFKKALVGDPVAKTQHFTNYIKAAPDSLFNSESEQSAFEKFKTALPAYPSGIHDYHYANRVLAPGVSVPDLAVWNSKLAHTLKQLGPLKQANAILVFTGNTDPNYAAALRQAWLGAKKNDIVLVMGTPAYPDVAWARVISWTDKQLFKVELADAVQDLKTVSPDQVLSLLREHTLKSFERKRMRDFEYLKWEIDPPAWLLGTLFALSLVASIFVSWVFASNGERTYKASASRKFYVRFR